MKRILNFCLIFTTALLVTGCGSKFKPTESAIYVTSKGAVKSAIVESFDKAYYDFEELSEDVKKEVQTYCLDKNNEEAVVVESLTHGEGEVSLFMNFQTAGDYAAFNEVLLFTGTYAEAVNEGYIPMELYDAEGISVPTDSKELDELKVIVTEESISVQTHGKIKYVSDNVSIVDKKLARAFEAGKTHPAFVLYK